MRENMIYNPRYYQLREQQVERILKIIKNNKDIIEDGVVFFGDSITELMDIEKYFPKIKNKYNCGIGAFTSENLLWIIDEAVIKYKPSHAILMIGTNDMGYTIMASPREIVLRVKEIIDIITLNIPNIKITLISPIPCDESLHGMKLGRGIRSNYLLSFLYKEYYDILINYSNIEILNVFPALVDKSTNNIFKEFTYDGLHLTHAGYNIYVLEIKKLSRFLE